MYEEVWGGYQPQSWSYDVIFTPQVTLTYQIWGQLGPCNSIRVQPCALETAYQCLKYIICLIWMYEEVWGGYWFQLWRYVVIFTPQVALTYQIWGQLGPCNSIRVQPCALETEYQCLNTLYMSNMDVWRGVRWVSTSIVTLWRHFHSSSDPDIPNPGPTWPM